MMSTPKPLHDTSADRSTKVVSPQQIYRPSDRYMYVSAQKLWGMTLCDARGRSLLKRFSRLPPLASQSVYKANVLYILFTYSANPI